MVTIRYSTFCETMKSYLDRVVHSRENLVVTRERDEDVVVISLDEWNDLQKKLRNLEYLQKIDESFRQLDSGNGTLHELIEVDDE